MDRKYSFFIIIGLDHNTITHCETEYFGQEGTWTTPIREFVCRRWYRRVLADLEIKPYTLRQR